MPITAAQVEANGWVLRLTVTGTPGSFASYALTPDGTPKVSLACVHPGFAPSGGTAVATPLARTIVATKPLRRPVNPASPTTFLVDETDNGNGTVTVRLALSDYVHATETSVTCTVLAGWRTGEPAASGIAVTNGSTFVAAVPIFRWARLGYQRETGAFDLELVVYSHYPQGLAPVAGVRFTVTDGTTVKTAWATALSTSTAYGDNLRCYRVTVDPATATALTAGLLRCDAEVYPWLGAMRSTDPAGTRSMTGLATAGYNDGAQRPHVVGYDPAGTRYGGQFVFVDPAGTTTASAAMVQSSRAAAKALAVGSRPADVSTALQAIYLTNRTMAAANGGASASRAADGAVITLAAGVSLNGATNVTTGITTSELPVVVEGDPTDANPRAACIWRTQTTNPSMRATKYDIRNMSLEIGTTGLVSGASNYYVLDNVELRGKAGSEASSAAPFTPNIVGQLPVNAVRSRWWRVASRFGGSTLRIGLLRNCEFSRTAEAAALLGGRFIPATEDGLVSGATNATSGLLGITTLGGAEDIIIANVDLRSVTGRVWQPVSIPAATAGTPNASQRRLVFANNLCERIGADPQPFFALGEDSLVTMSYNLIEGNTFAGERCNLFYSDPFPATALEADTLLNQAFGNRVANNAFDWAPTKHDAFFDSTTATRRGNTNGYRPHMVEAWSILYAVGWEGNVDFGRHPSAGSFAFEYFGLRGLQTTGGVPAWPDDRSVLGGGSGGGSYRPPAASIVAGRGRRANVDRDRSGNARNAIFTSGAEEVPAVLAVSLVPDSARSASRGTSSLLGWIGALLPFGARSLHVAASARVDWAAMLTPASNQHAAASTSPRVDWAALLSPAPAQHVAASTSPVIALPEPGLAPASAYHVLRDVGAAVLPDLVFATPRLVRIAGEVRVQIVEPDQLMLVC